MQFQHLFAHALAFDVDFHFLLDGNAGHFFVELAVRIYPRLGLGAAGLGLAAHPVQFFFEQFTVFLQLDVFVFGAGGFFLQKIRIIAAVFVHLTLIQFHDLVANPFQKVAVVGHHQDGKVGLGQVFFQPLNHVEVQVVGGLIEDQKIGVGQDHAHQGEAFFLSARKRPHRLGMIVDAKAGEQFF